MSCLTLNDLARLCSKMLVFQQLDDLFCVFFRLRKSQKFAPIFPHSFGPYMRHGKHSNTPQVALVRKFETVWMAETIPPSSPAQLRRNHGGNNRASKTQRICKKPAKTINSPTSPTRSAQQDPWPLTASWLSWGATRGWWCVVCCKCVRVVCVCVCVCVCDAGVCVCA
jgi:hypothetical protein